MQKLDLSGEKPIFLQIAESLEDAVLSGALMEEGQLPSITGSQGLAAKKTPRRVFRPLCGGHGGGSKAPGRSPAGAAGYGRARI